MAKSMKKENEILMKKENNNNKKEEYNKEKKNEEEEEVEIEEKEEKRKKEEDDEKKNDFLNNKKNNNNLGVENIVEYDNSKTLLVSAKRQRSFLERTCKELFAGGTEVIVLCALGDAIPLAANLQMSLEKKKTAEAIRVETTYNKQSSRFGTVGYTPGIRIYMRKDEKFKGSRISPGYVSFSEEKIEDSNKNAIFDFDDMRKGCAILFPSVMDKTETFGSDNENFVSFLSGNSQSTVSYHVLHRHMVERSLESNKNKPSNEIRSVLMKYPAELHPDVKLALCRVCGGELLALDPSAWTGSVTISLFKNTTADNNASNVVAVCVVAPKASSFESKEQFLNAVELTSINIMTALCDFNGFIRREETKMMPKISICKFFLFPNENYFFSDTKKYDVAQAILSGLEKAYRHGPAPHINFIYDEDVFKKAWIERTGVEIFSKNKLSQSAYNARNNNN